jgi:hypothetical protein
MKGPQYQEHYGLAALHPGEGPWDPETRRQNTEEQTCQQRMTADLLVLLMTRCLTGASDPCTVGHAHVWAVTGQRVRVQMSDLILIGE